MLSNAGCLKTFILKLLHHHFNTREMTGGKLLANAGKEPTNEAGISPVFLFSFQPTLNLQDLSFSSCKDRSGGGGYLEIEAGEMARIKKETMSFAVGTGRLFKSLSLTGYGALFFFVSISNSLSVESLTIYKRNQFFVTGELYGH